MWATAFFLTWIYLVVLIGFIQAWRRDPEPPPAPRWVIWGIAIFWPISAAYFILDDLFYALLKRLD